MRRPGYLAPHILHPCFNQFRKAESYLRNLQFLSCSYKMSLLYRNMILYHAQNSSTLVCILNQIHSVYAFPSLNIHLTSGMRKYNSFSLLFTVHFKIAINL